MAGLRTRRSPHRNPPLGSADELVGGLPGAPTEDSNTPILFSAVSHTSTFALLSTNELFKQFMKVIWSLTKGLASLQRSANNLLKLRCRMYIIVNCTWTATTSASSVKIILRPLGPPGPTKPSLQLTFFVAISAYDGRSSSVVEVRK